MKKSKFLRGLLKVIFVLAILNSVITFGFIVTDFIYHRMRFELPILLWLLLSGIIWVTIGYVNSKNKLNL